MNQDRAYTNLIFYCDYSQRTPDFLHYKTRLSLMLNQNYCTSKLNQIIFEYKDKNLIPEIKEFCRFLVNNLELKELPQNILK